jgi:dynamin 1-like protein
VERRLRALALSYARDPAALLLAVTPADADVATSDALQLAREADPAGERTIGVLTKVDLAAAAAAAGARARARAEGLGAGRRGGRRRCCIA